MCPGIMSAHDDSVRRHQDFLIAHARIPKEPRGHGDQADYDRDGIDHFSDERSRALGAA